MADNSYEFKDLRAMTEQEADNNDNYYRDPTHIDPIENEITNGKKDAISLKIAEWIRQKKWGIDVREAMARITLWNSVLTNKQLDDNADTRKIAMETQTKQNDVDAKQQAFEDEFNQKYNAQIAGNTDINEVIDARRSAGGKAYITLKQRLDSMEDASAAEEEINQEISVGIRHELFDEHAARITNALSSRVTNVNIAQITDVHYIIKDSYWGERKQAATGITHYLNVGSVSKRFDFAISTGDNVDGRFKTKDTVYKYNKDAAATLLSVCECPSALLKGNHDDNSMYSAEVDATAGYDTAITDADFKQLYYQDGRFGEHRNNGSNYFYYDVKGIRIIGLDSYNVVEEITDQGGIKNPRSKNSAFSPAQVKWLYEEALKTDLPVIIFSHTSLKDVWGGQGVNYNHSAVYELIKAFKNGTSGTINTAEDPSYAVNFSYSFSKPGTVIAYVCGHHHREDYQVKDNINFVITGQSFGSNGPRERDSYVSYFDTSNEDSWSVFSINRAARKVEILKFGRGEGRTFNY